MFVALNLGLNKLCNCCAGVVEVVAFGRSGVGLFVLVSVAAAVQLVLVFVISSDIVMDRAWIITN